MAIRFWSNPGRIIVSRPGFNAAPALADQNKIFDSDWNFSGLIIAKGTIVDPAPARGGGWESLFTDSTDPIVVNFSGPGYIPTATVLNINTNNEQAKSNDFPFDDESSQGRLCVYTSGKPYVTAIHAVVSANSLTIPRVARNSFSDWRARYPGTIEYTVYAIGAN